MITPKIICGVAPKAAIFLTSVLATSKMNFVLRVSVVTSMQLALAHAEQISFQTTVLCKSTTLTQYVWIPHTI
jgi:hypothetical protein